MGEGERHSGRPGPRLGRGLGRRLGADHHRSRPARAGLLFERFLNPERVSMPDFDIDFCETHRDKVITLRPGASTAATRSRRSSPSGGLKARAVLKDTGRVLQMSYGQVDRLAKLIPNHPTDPWTLERSLNGVAGGRGRVQRTRTSSACSTWR